MLFSEILGLKHIKSYLATSADRKRIPHAQLFVGPNGSGTLPMAIAYAQYILCQNENGENTNGNQSCNIKFDHLAHPDLHFAYPVAVNDKVKKHPTSNHFAEEWRSFVKENPYGSIFDWYLSLGIEKKQGQIGVDEALEIVKKLSLKSYEGGYKVMLIWMANKMNIAASNKLLKLIEEPPEKTVFILIAEDEEQLIQTIRSRCQVLHFPPLGEQVIKDVLLEKENLSDSEASKIAHQANGDYSKALHLLHHDGGDDQFEEWFIQWVRTAFRAKGNKSAINDLISWSESIAGTGRETQKKFLNYCLDFFRQALLLNYGAKDLVFLEPTTSGFKLENFAPFIHGANIMDICTELQDAAYHIERNGNAKIVLTDLSIKLTRLLHKKS
ncbi:DNA polymerase III subunit delta' [Aquimarina sp. AD10]|uniref:DNA polymerase III subunit delta n=1 Tax=Aquimarina aggregata TaxID=1642818 RepID=A0A162CMT5_9FLAO|nr:MULTISPECIES: DNA polymerase III subunit delta' [Aquimarina]AXT61861.1 DNA polymerase III subunit delta' [Aquimarina sp. AD10]KZS39534.1 DNA polymerase III subunit delta' [Aquimarina aggregata]RKN02657.1 DNA polymerase III subunit delta' [Aquimarina sp. AD10]